MLVAPRWAVRSVALTAEKLPVATVAVAFLTVMATVFGLSRLGARCLDCPRGSKQVSQARSDDYYLARC